MALRVLAHLVRCEKVLNFLAPETDWLDIRWCADDDSPESQAVFCRELPDAEVIWHVLRPLSGADLRRGARLRLVHKLGAGVNTDRGRRQLPPPARRLRDGQPLAHVVNQPTGC